MSELMDLVQVAKEAGAIMKNAVHMWESVHEKSGHANFATDYDERIQAFLFERLAQLEPEASFLGEEDGHEVFLPEYKKGLVFVVDPIDGTSNFLVGYRPSVVSIGLLKDGRPYRAVVYNPYFDMCFWAEAGKGAFLNGKPVHSSKNSLADSLIVFGTSPYYPDCKEETFRLAAEYLDRCIDLRRSGSAEWDLCSVAAGWAGMFFELRVSLWDYAAGALIVEEAGGKVTDLEGKPLTFEGKSSMLAVSEGVAREEYMP